MFEQWIEDQREDYDIKKNIAILIGSFTNPEAAKKMLNLGGVRVESSEEDFAGSIKMMEQQGHRRRRKLTDG